MASLANPLRPPRPWRLPFARSDRFILGGSAQPVDDRYVSGRWL